MEKSLSRKLSLACLALATFGYLWPPSASLALATLGLNFEVLEVATCDFLISLIQQARRSRSEARPGKKKNPKLHSSVVMSKHARRGTVMDT